MANCIAIVVDSSVLVRDVVQNHTVDFPLPGGILHWNLQSWENLIYVRK